MSNPEPKDNRTPFERLVRLGWEAMEAVRREPPTFDRLTQNALEAIESTRKGLLTETSLRTFDFLAPLDGGTSARVELELSVGESKVYALPASDDTLIAAHLTYLGALSFGVSGDVQRQVFLRQATQLTVGWANPINWAARPSWDIGLSPKVPLDLRVQMGVGDAQLDLSRVQLQALRVDGNIGSVNVTLPATGMSYLATVRGAAGPIGLNIPRGASGRVDVRGGVGGLGVTIARGAAVKLTVAGGVGRVMMAPGFNRMEATAPVLPNTGIWETDNYHEATHRVDIDLADGMVGNVMVKVLAD